MLVLLLLFGAALAYDQLTDERRLRAFAEQWLSDFSGGEVHIEGVRFDPFRGLELIGVTVATPAAAGFDPKDDTLAARTIFQSSGLFLRLRPFSAITGKLVVPEVVAVDPEIRLIHRLDDDARNWQVMLGRRRPTTRRGGPMQLPMIRLRNLRVAQYRLDEQGRSGGAPQIMWADAQPAQGAADCYDLQIARVLTSDDGTAISADHGRLRVNLRTLALSGSIPAMSLDDLALLAPADMLRRLDVFKARGLIRAEALQFDRNTGTEATIRLTDVSLSVPISAEEEPLDEDDRYIRLSGVSGTVKGGSGGYVVDLSGRFRDAPVTLRGQVVFAGDAMNLDGLGLDLKVSGTDLAFPQDAETAGSAERRFARRWPALKEFIEDYDPRGRADFEFQLRKRAGPATSVEFVEGSMRLKGANGRYFRFPYRLYELSGEVHFRPDRRIELRDLSGVHGTGRAVINGLVDGPVSQGYNVNIRATDIDLDDDLVTCLNKSNQELVRMFSARAQMNLDIRLRRGASPHRTPVEQNPYQAGVDVEFLDGTASFEKFPYALGRIRGRMRIDESGFHVTDLRGAHGPATVTLNGRVRRRPGEPAELNLELAADALPLDADLGAALPPEARRLYAELAPDGQAHLTGRIFSAAGTSEPIYELTASLNAAATNLPETGVRLRRSLGRIRITPAELIVDSLQGFWGDSELVLAGRFATKMGGPAVLHATCERLLLDERLRAALPPTIQAAWDLVHPTGPVRLDLHYSRGTTATAPGSAPALADTPATGPAPAAMTYTAVLEPLDAGVQLADFPIALNRVNGRCTLTPERILLEKMSGACGEMEFDLDGAIQLAPGDLRGSLRLALRRLTFTEELRRAVPWRLRRLWNDVKPRGTVDLTLEKLTFHRTAEGNTWDAGGYADLDDFCVDVGTPITGLRGRVTGSGSMGESVALDMKLELARAEVDGRTVTDARMAMSRKAGDTRLNINDLTARFYDGDVLGEMEVNYTPGRPKYGLSLSGRGISLEKFLNAKRPPDQPPVSARGSIEGTLAFSGQFGNPTATRGAGTIFIRDARMFRIPLIFSILQVVHGHVQDDNAFHDAKFSYAINGQTLLLTEIDLRGRSLSMVGAGRVYLPTQALDLTLLVGSPLKLPRVEVLSDLVEGVARELMEVHVEGTLEQPQLRAEMVRSVRKALDAVFNARRLPPGGPEQRR